MQFALILFFILPALTYATEIYRGDRENVFEFVYGDGGAYFHDRIAIRQDGWPRLVKRERVPSVPAAKRAFANRRRILKLKTENVPLRNKNGVTLWPITNQWNWDWELRYTEWVKQTMSATWWRENNISTDCADVVLSARWIFARNNGLPVANHLITGNWFTHESVKPEWEGLPTAADWREDQRFLAALDFLLSQAYTHSLWLDSYPVEISANALRPGGYHVQLDSENGHVQFIHQIGTQPDQVPVLTLNSTVPREVRDLFEFVFTVNTADSRGSGFTRMRWPKEVGAAVSLVPAEEMPYYSREQFDYDFVKDPRYAFWEEVFYRLNPNADFDLIAKATLRQISDAFKARIPVVEKGYEVCSKEPCAIGSLNYELWSTPTRDARILTNISVYDGLMTYVDDWAPIRAILNETILKMGWNSLSLRDLINVWKDDRYSSDPNDTPETRWGL